MRGLIALQGGTFQLPRFGSVAPAWHLLCLKFPGSSFLRAWPAQVEEAQKALLAAKASWRGGRGASGVAWPPPAVMEVPPGALHGQPRGTWHSELATRGRRQAAAAQELNSGAQVKG